MLRFSDTNSLGFAGDVETTSSNQLMCYGPVQPEALADKSNLLFVPGESEDHSNRILQEISNQLSSSLASSYYLPAGIAGDILKHLHETRKQYISALEATHKAWIDDGRKVTKKVADNMIALRKITRQSSRAQDPIPNFAYKIVDKYRESKRSGDPSFVKLYKQGNYRGAIEASVRAGPATKFTTIGSGVGKLLKKGSAIVMVADISTSAGRVYFANTPEEQQAALSGLGEDLGSSLGVYGGAKFCTALIVTTGGIGVVGCAIALGAGIYLGGRLGSMIVGGQAANDLVNSVRSNF
ncbi:hypothetical protein [Vibrio mytili]|uniref:Uncharacterized protein n=1 Tax=Vibrio mytili TaxID=50718 RepID=A0A0C3E692_9VIBR|nr:hypothetical protein [Vibrio mytili]KIN09908.1 hypothetical protein SU60_16305 [Vibrio mytili]